MNNSVSFSGARRATIRLVATLPLSVTHKGAASHG